MYARGFYEPFGTILQPFSFSFNIENTFSAELA